MLFRSLRPRQVPPPPPPVLPSGFSPRVMELSPVPPRPALDSVIVGVLCSLSDVEEVPESQLEPATTASPASLLRGQESFYAGGDLAVSAGLLSSVPTRPALKSVVVGDLCSQFGVEEEPQLEETPGTRQDPVAMPQPPPPPEQLPPNFLPQVLPAGLAGGSQPASPAAGFAAPTPSSTGW